MIDYRSIYHTGIAVRDMASAQREFEQALGVEWAPIHVYDPLRLWTPGGWIAVRIEAVYSREGPHHLELIQGEKGSIYDPDAIEDAKHIGVWVDSVGQEAERMIGLGWTVTAARNSPEKGYGHMAYLRPPQAGWPVIELVSVELKPMLEAWYVEPHP
jgi:hypothetical protein